MKCNKERFADCLVRETHFIEKCNLYAILNKKLFRPKTRSHSCILEL